MSTIDIPPGRAAPAVVVITLPWGDWIRNPAYRSWDGNLELRRARTAFGDYLLLRRHGGWPGCRTTNVGKWYVARPGADHLGPFNDDVAAARAAQDDLEARTMLLLKGMGTPMEDDQTRSPPLLLV